MIMGISLMGVITASVAFWFVKMGQSESIANFRGVSQGNVYEYAFEKTEALKTEHRNMINHLNGKSNTICSLLEAKKILETVDLILKSNSTGKTIYV